jgi:hypothetical protein
MNTPRQGKKLLFRRVLVALAMALTVAAPAVVVQRAGGNSCGWQTGCRELPLVCVDKETGKEAPCPPPTVKGEDNEDLCIHPSTGQVVNCGWQTGFTND